MLVPDTPMSDNGSMKDEERPKGLEALEAALASADPAEAPEIAEALAAELSEELDDTATVSRTEGDEEQPS